MESQSVINVVNNYSKALSRKILLENINNMNFTLEPTNEQSVYLWGNNNNIINIVGKFNHLFMYECNRVYLKIDELVSGITIIGSHNCDVMFKKTPLTSIEVSNSGNISLRSIFYNMPILFNGVNMNIIKSVDYQIKEYYNINDSLYSNWNYKFFNF